jgi:phosphoenolpyruvate carboxykinase (ATP)
MQEKIGPPTQKNLSSIGIEKVQEAFWNLEPAELIERAVKNEEGFLSDTGAFTADTGEFTGRSPKDRYIVKDVDTDESIWWGNEKGCFFRIELYSGPGAWYFTHALFCQYWQRG